MTAATRFLDIPADLFERQRPMLRVETPIARNTDPATSHAAAREVTASGARAHQQQQATAAVRQFPGRTSQELAELMGLDRYMLARRLPEAETALAVRKGDARLCSITKRRAVTWWLV